MSTCLSNMFTQHIQNLEMQNAFIISEPEFMVWHSVHFTSIQFDNRLRAIPINESIIRCIATHVAALPSVPRGIITYIGQSPYTSSPHLFISRFLQLITKYKLNRLPLNPFMNILKFTVSQNWIVNGLFFSWQIIFKTTKFTQIHKHFHACMPLRQLIQLLISYSFDISQNW